jgi:hypothetical protein
MSPTVERRASSLVQSRASRAIQGMDDARTIQFPRMMESFPRAIAAGIRKYATYFTS